VTLEGRVREYLEEEASFLPLPLYPHPYPHLHPYPYP